MTPQHQTPAFLAGSDAFRRDLGQEPPHPYGSPDYQQWWEGWQAEAEAFLADEFAKAKFFGLS